MTNPIFSYAHTAGCRPSRGARSCRSGAWPAQYDDAYLYGDFVCGNIYALKPSGGGYNQSEFATGLGVNSMTGMIIGPDGPGQSLYYMTWASSATEGHQVRKISYTGTANRPPSAEIAADPTSGALPLDVNFDATSSIDLDGDPLTFEWDFGDGSPHASGATTTHQYTSAGTYNATVVVRDNRGGEDSRSLRIDAGNTAPMPQIDSPTPDTRFSVGEEITLTGSATDAEDGPLADTQLTWTVDRHHNTHMHPYLPPTSGNDVSILGPMPEDLQATTTSYLEIRLTATDSSGLSRTITQDFRPKLVDLTFETDPAGLGFDVNQVEMTGPQTVTSWEAWQLILHAQDQTDGAGEDWGFHSVERRRRGFTLDHDTGGADHVHGQVHHGYPRPKGATRSCLARTRLQGLHDARSPARPTLAYDSCSNPDADLATPDRRHA